MVSICQPVEGAPCDPLATCTGSVALSFILQGSIHLDMQDRYTADVGDFGKYALLNALSGTDVRLGVMWYLNSVEESNADGRFTDYASLKPCDPLLHGKLSLILKREKRNLLEIETGGILPSGTVFYHVPLPFPKKSCFTDLSRNQQRESRTAWFMQGFQELSSVDLVFLDPDNGVAGERAKKHQRSSVKYVFIDEISRWLERNQSVVVYQHQRRTPLETQISDQLRVFGRHGSSGWSLSFHRQSVRIYFVLPASESHRAILRERSNAFLKGQWGRGAHFR